MPGADAPPAWVAGYFCVNAPAAWRYTASEALLAFIVACILIFKQKPATKAY